VAAWRLARAGTGRALARELARRALGPAGADRPCTPRVYAARALRYAGDVVEAVRALDAVVRDARGAGAPMPAAFALLERAVSELVRGNLSRADEDVDAARTELPLTSWHPSLLPRLVAVDAARHLARGDADAAERVLGADLPAGATDGTAWAALRYVQGCLRMALADPAAALPYFLDCGRVLGTRRWTSPAGPAWRSMAAAAYAATGDRTAAATLIRDATDRARAWGAPDIRRQVHALAARTGCADAARHHAEAVALLPAGWCPPAATEAAGTGGPAGGIPLPGEDERLATLVAAGWANADIARFLSVATRTVEARLTALYRRLGLSGRHELAGRWSPPRWRGDVRYDADSWLLRTHFNPERFGR
jgi:ATP/maltotriose-dependent transcriptional regulator MalT